MARKLVNTKEISHDEWLTLRKKSIGGSDAGAIMGMNPWSSPITLYAEKAGLSKDRETTEAMRLGTDLEDYVARRWMEETGKKVRVDNFMYMHDEHDFLTANVDRDVVGENAGLECKTMTSFAKYDLEDGEIPAQYFCQCQHYMMVKGYDRMYLAILVLQRGIYCLTVERDEQFIKELLGEEICFWKDHVKKKEMPAPDGSDAAAETLAEIYPTGHGALELPNSDADIKRYRELADVIKDFESEQDAIKQRLCARLGDSDTGIDKEFQCSWKNQSRTSVDSKKLKAEYPEVYAAVTKTSESRVFRTKKLG